MRFPIRSAASGGMLALVVCVLGVAAAPPPSAVPAPAAGTGEPAIGLTAAELDWLAEHPQVRLAPYANYAPAQFVDDQGVHRGIAADYVARIEAMLPVEFVNVYTDTWREILELARDREVDVIALAADTLDRRPYLTFTESYLDLPAVIIARSAVEHELTPEDLVDLRMRVAVVEGYAVHDYLKENYPELELDLVPRTSVGLRRVAFGIADAFISDLAVASHYIEAEGVTNLRVVGESGFVYHMGFAVRSDWPQLAGILDKALARIGPEQRREIFNRWITVSHETEFASRRLLNTLGIALGAIIVLAGAVLVWNRSLHRRVRDKTEALNRELVERTRGAEALAQSEARTRMIISTALDAVITMDGQGSVTGWSPQAERAFGWSRAEVLGRPLAGLIIPERYREAHLKGLERFTRTGDGPMLNRRIELTALHKAGHEIPVELSIASIQRGDSYEFSAFVRDITERKRNEAELEKHRSRLAELVVERTGDLRHAKEDLALRVRELEEALAEVKTLRGLLPICSYCKRVREGEAYTKSVEAYLAEHSETKFSHGVCPDCYKKHVRPQLERL